MRKLTTNNILIETNTYFISNRVTIEDNTTCKEYQFITNKDIMAESFIRYKA